jgi:HK97 family phage portal protein
MGLLTDGFKALASLGGDTKMAIAAAIPTWQIGMPQTPLVNTRGYDQLARKGYMGSEVVFAACQAAAKSAASPRMVVYGSKEPDADPLQVHPALDVLNRPNPYWTHFQMWASTVVALKIAGNAYWERVRDARGRVIEYWPLRPDRMWVIPDPKTFIRGYEYRLGDQTFLLKPEDVVHFKNPHPLNDYYGLAPLAVLAERIDIDVWTREFTTAFFRNAGVPSGLLNIMRSVEPNEREIIRQRFRQQYGGPDGWGNTLVIDNGQATYTKMGMDPGNIGLDEINRISESKICAVLDVPPSIIWTVLGHQSSSGLNNSNKQSDRAQWWEGSLAPMYEDLAQQYTLSSTDDWPDVDHFAFDLSQVPGFAKDEDAVHTRVRADFAAGLLQWHVAMGMLNYDPDEAGWVILPATMIPTPSDQLAHYKKGDTPPGPGAALPPGGAAGAEGGGGPGGGGGGGGQPPSGGRGGGPPGGAAGPRGEGAQSGGGGSAGAGAGGEGEKMLTASKTSSDGLFDIIPGCPEDSTGDHYRSKQLGVCAWCGQDPWTLKLDAAAAYDYSSTQLNLPDILSKELVQWTREHIDPDDLGSEGIETQPHITVKYGLMPNVSPSDVARVVKNQAPAAMTFGPNYVFAGANEGGGVPLYVSIASEDLHRLNGVIKRGLANVETHSNYEPHVTLAYIKPESVQKYVGQRSPLYGMHITLGDLTYSGNDGRAVSIPLSNKILTEGIDTNGGIFVPPDNARKPRRRKAQDLWLLLDHWRDQFAVDDGRNGIFTKAQVSLDDEPLGLVAWLYHETTGRWPTKIENGERLNYKAGNLEALLDYWRERFDGGHPGDFDDCVSTMTDKVDNPEAICAWLHHEATGYWPGHAPDEESSKLLNEVVDGRDELTKKVTEQVREMERSLLQSGTPVQPFRPKTQTWLSILDLPGESKEFNPDQPRDQNGRWASQLGGEGEIAKGDSSHLISKENSTGWLQGTHDSQSLYRKPGTKEYTEARAALHKGAVDAAQHGRAENHPALANGALIPKSKGPLTVTAMGGGGAAGKTSLLTKGAVDAPSKDEAVYSNADFNKSDDLPEYQAMVDANDKRAAATMHEESSDVAKSVITEALKNGRDVVADAVMDNSMSSVASKVSSWRDQGAQVVNGNYISVPVQQALDAAKERYEKTNRYVPLDVLQSAHNSVNKLLPDLLNSDVYDNLKVYDNTKFNPTLVAERSGGKVTIHHPDLWATIQKRADPNFKG